MTKKPINKTFLAIRIIVVTSVILIIHHKTKVETPKSAIAVKCNNTTVATEKLINPSPDYQVVDGDTIRNGDIRIRLWGIDAPELHQVCRQDNQNIQCGQESKNALAKMIKDRKLNCALIDTDQYNRQVSLCMVNGVDINRLMITQGWALDYTHYSKSAYKDAENRAKDQKIGIWGYQFDVPSDWRRANP